MAGILSKGITLACRGFAGRQFKHIFYAKNDMDETEFTVEIINNDPTPIKWVYNTNTNYPQFVGGICVNKNGGDPEDNSRIVSAYVGGTSLNFVTTRGNDEADSHYFGVTLYKKGDVNGVYDEVESEVVAITAPAGNFAELTNLQEIPELGNNAPEKIDVTVLSDGAKKSIAGLADTAQDLAFKFLYEKPQFDTLAAMEGSHEWRVTLPDGTVATFFATPSVKLAGAGVSAALTYTLSLSVESEIVFA